MLLLAAGGSYYYVKVYKKKPAPVTKTNTALITQTQSAPQIPVAENIIYASRAKETDPFVIYSRPAKGGDRTTLLTLTNKNASGSYGSIAQTKSRGQNIVFSDTDSIYSSTNGGKTFKQVFKAPAPASANTLVSVNSLTYSVDGKSIVFTIITTGSNKAVTSLKTMDLNGQNVSDIKITNADNKTIYIYSFDSQKKQMVYATGCYACDGGPDLPQVADLSAGTAKPLVTADKTKIFTNGQVSSDGQNYDYIAGNNDDAVATAIDGPALGWQGAPPYNVVEVNVNSGKATPLATIGTLHEKGADGKLKSYTVHAGYTNDLTPFYVADNKLFMAGNNSTGAAFAANSNIDGLPEFLTANEYVIDVLNPSTTTTPFTAYYYDVASKKSTAVLQADTNTVIIGVTSK